MATKQTVKAADRMRQALELRMAGYTYDAIAEQLGYRNRSGAYLAVDRALKATLREPADHVRELEQDRLDRLQRGVWDEAVAGNEFKIDRVLKIMQRRAEMLGIDPPKKFAPTTPDGSQPVPITRIEIVRPPDDRDPAAADGDR